MDRRLRTHHRCPVCAFSEVVTDQVVEGGVLALGACPRCDHRWTDLWPRSGFPRAVRPAARSHGGQDSAAA